MFFSHRRILSLPVSPGSLSFQSSRKGTPTYSLFPHLFIVALEDYLKLKNTTEFDVYLQGYLAGVTWANAWLSSEKRPRLFCQSNKLALNVPNLKQIIEDHYEKQKSMNQPTNEHFIGSIA